MDVVGDFDWWDGDPGCLDAALADADCVAGGDVSDGFGPVADEDWAPRTVAEVIAEIDAAGPGPEAQRLLAELACLALTADHKLTVVELWESQASWLAAQRNTATVAFAGLEPTVQQGGVGIRVDDWAVFELMLALGCSERFAQTRLYDARTLASTLVGTGAMLAAGLLSEYKAKLLIKHTQHLDPELARQVEATVLPKAAVVKTATLVRAIGRAVIAADPTAAQRRHAEGRAN